MLLCLAAWLVPGAGHLWKGRRAKGLMFLLALPVMFGIGLLNDGRLSPLDFSQPIIGLAVAFASAGIGLPYMIASAMGGGGGSVTAATYEYGNVFLIVSGLLNLLVVMDAYDIAKDRK